MEKHLYVMRSAEGPVKIGISEHPDRRRREVSLSSGREIVEMFVSPAIERCEEIERALHNHFEKKRRPGEWFDVDYLHAVRIASEFGVKESPKAWAMTAKYVRGKRASLAIFTANAEHGSDDRYMQGFVEAIESVGLLDDALFADRCDMANTMQELHESANSASKTLQWMRRIAEEEQDGAMFKAANEIEASTNAILQEGLREMQAVTDYFQPS